MVTALGDLMTAALLTPFALLMVVILLAILTGRMPIGGILAQQC